MINRDTIKEYLGITVDTYDNQIDATIFTMLNKLCAYCNNDFVISKMGYSETYDNLSTSISGDTFTVDFTIPIVAGDYIRIYQSLYNDGLYLIGSVDTGEFTVEQRRLLKTEERTMYITIVEFPPEFLDLIAQYINISTINNSNIVKEKIDEVEYQYSDKVTIDAFLKSNADVLQPYRYVYKKKFVGGL